MQRILTVTDARKVHSVITTLRSMGASKLDITFPVGQHWAKVFEPATGGIELRVLGFASSESFESLEAFAQYYRAIG